MKEENTRAIKEIEEENLIIIDGLKREYEEKIKLLEIEKEALTDKIVALENQIKTLQKNINGLNGENQKL